MNIEKFNKEASEIFENEVKPQIKKAMKQQTAVEWLALQIKGGKFRFGDNISRTVIINQAKAMEKEQIVDAYQTSHISMMTAEQYYNETYEKL